MKAATSENLISIQHMTTLPKGRSHVIEEKITNQCRHVKLRISPIAMVDAARADSSYKLSNRAVAFSCKICHAALTCVTSVNGAPTAKRRMYSPDRTCTYFLSSTERTYYVGYKKNRSLKLIYAYRVCNENISR
jgi:hypothetical protein